MGCLWQWTAWGIHNRKSVELATFLNYFSLKKKLTGSELVYLQLQACRESQKTSNQHEKKPLCYGLMRQPMMENHAQDIIVRLRELQSRLPM